MLSSDHATDGALVILRRSRAPTELGLALCAEKKFLLFPSDPEFDLALRAGMLQLPPSDTLLPGSPDEHAEKFRLFPSDPELDLALRAGMLQLSPSDLLALCAALLPG